jgi:hypothetical protein
MENLAHSASRHSCEKSAPSNPGIKHLGRSIVAAQTTIESLATAFSVRKRAVPTVTWYSSSGVAARVRDPSSGNDLVVSGQSAVSDWQTGAPILSSGIAAGILLQANWVADAEL